MSDSTNSASTAQPFLSPARIEKLREPILAAGEEAQTLRRLPNDIVDRDSPLDADLGILSLPVRALRLVPRSGPGARADL